MLDRNRKTDEFKKEMRKQQLNDWLIKQRNRCLLVSQQEAEYRQTGNLGLELLEDLSCSAEREDIKKRRDSYPLQKFHPFLSSTFDNSKQQMAALKVIQQYFYVGYSSPPEESFIDSILRFLTQDGSIEAIKLAIRILSDIVQDHYRYNIFLIGSKKIIPKLLWILQTYVNNSEIKFLVCKLTQFLVTNTVWHEDIPQLVDPIFRMMHEQAFTIPKIINIIQVLYYIARLNKDYFARILYGKNIHQTCLNIIKQHQSRETSVLYLRFLVMFEDLLTGDEVNDALAAIAFMHQKKFKIGESRAKYTIQEIKLTSYKFINCMLRSDNDAFWEAALKLFSSDVLQSIINELEESDNQEILITCGRLLNAYYYKSAKKPISEHQSILETAISKCDSSNERCELENEFSYIMNGANGHQDMDIEQDKI